MSNLILTNANYDNLGLLLLAVILVTLFLPCLTALIIQKTKYQTNE